MTSSAYEFKQVSVSLDSKDKEALAKINTILDGAGVAAVLLSALHVYSWANMNTGIITVGLEDWNQVANAIAGSNTFALAAVHRIIGRQMLRHQLSGTPEQYQFWASYEAAVVTAMKRN